MLYEVITYFQTEPYYDLKSVEVLRGPQGTFVGKNAAGGAVFRITSYNVCYTKLLRWERGPFRHQIELRDGKCISPSVPGASTDFTAEAFDRYRTS